MVEEHLTLYTYLQIVRDPGFKLWKWKSQGECLKVIKKHPDQYHAMDWFPVQDKFVPPEVAVVCDACPVRLECLASAIFLNEGSGIWGGKSLRQRKRMRRKIQLALRNRRLS